MSRQTRVALAVAGLAATVFASVPRAQAPAPFNIQANYTKYESYISPLPEIHVGRWMRR